MGIGKLLKSMVKENISDLHLKVGSPPRFRLNGKLHPVDPEKLTKEDIEKLFRRQFHSFFFHRYIFQCVILRGDDIVRVYLC